MPSHFIPLIIYSDVIFKLFGISIAVTMLCHEVRPRSPHVLDVTFSTKLL